MEGYGPNGKFIRIPPEIVEQGRKRAIVRWVRRNPCEAKQKLKDGKVADADLKVFVNALRKFL